MTTSKEYYQWENILHKCMRLYNRTARYIHSRYPEIGHTDVDMLSCAWVAIVLLGKKGKSWDFVEAYLRYCTLFRDDLIEATKSVMELLVSCSPKK